MKTKKILLLLCLTCGVLCTGAVSCSYHNDDNPNEYPDPKPDPEPEPEPTLDVDSVFLAASYAPNCYMATPGNAVDIPILKAYAMWNLYAERLGDDNFDGSMPEPVLLWQDSPDLIANVGLISGQEHKDYSIVVSTTNKVGNAVIGICIGGKIRWSWHIWVTRYNPDTEKVAYGKVYTLDNNDDGIKDYTFMDRNLGAVIDKTIIESTTADSLAACGLLYQWGRKDPFPGDHDFQRTNKTDYNYFDSKPIYNAAGVQLVESSRLDGTGIRTIKTNVDSEHTGFWKSIVEPMTFLLGSESYNDWFCSKEPLITKCDTLWLDSHGKTPFDPCPEGWRVPANKNELFVWNGFGNATTDYSSLGVFPYAGYRYCLGGGCLKNSGFAASIWAANTNPSTGNVNRLSIYIIPSNKQPAIKRDISCRSDGLAIRCVRDE